MADDRKFTDDKSDRRMEIIPPDRDSAYYRGEDTEDWTSAKFRGDQRLYISRVGPFGSFLFLLLLSIIFIVIGVVILGAFLIWIPLAILIAVAAIVAGLLRSYLRRRN